LYSLFTLKMNKISLYTLTFSFDFKGDPVLGCNLETMIKNYKQYGKKVKVLNMLMIYFGVMKMTSQQKWRHFPFFVYVFILAAHWLFILWCTQCFQYIKANSFSHKNYDFLEMSLSNSLQFKKNYNTKCVSIILYIYIPSTPMY
jgi:hypothetical protein